MIVNNRLFKPDIFITFEKNMKNIILFCSILIVLFSCKKKENNKIEDTPLIDNTPKDSCSLYGICMTGLYEYYTPGDFNGWNDTALFFKQLRVKFDGFIPPPLPRPPADSLQYSFHAKTFSQNLLDPNFKNHFKINQKGYNPNSPTTIVVIVQFKSGKRASFYRVSY